MNRILLKENACGKEMNIHIKGSATEGICFTIQIPNEGIDREGKWCVEEFIIHLQEEQNWFVCCKILFFNRIQIHFLSYSSFINPFKSECQEEEDLQYYLLGWQRLMLL